jgi:hypothetical protein
VALLGELPSRAAAAAAAALVEHDDPMRMTGLAAPPLARSAQQAMYRSPGTPPSTCSRCERRRRCGRGAYDRARWPA